MLKNQLPKFSYKGLTIILSEPSRFDLRNNRFFSGDAGVFFQQDCLRPEINLLQCDIRIAEIEDPLLEGTRCLLLLGEKAFKRFTSPEISSSFSLDNQRGCLLPSIYGPKIPAIASYTPQDARDRRNWELEYNPLKLEERLAFHDKLEKEETDKEVKDHSKTLRKNYSFWLQRDTKRAINITLNGIPKFPSPNYEIFPPLDKISRILKEIQDKNIFIDIECDFEGQNLWCIGIGFNFEYPIFVIPIFRFNGELAYGNSTFNFLGLLARAFQRNTTVIYNSQFDLLVLAHRYGIPFGRRQYDVMLAHWKTFPDIEKSLGHAMSHLTFLPYHKQEGIFFPQNYNQEQQLWKYNGKDIYGMMLVYNAIENFASQDPGLRDSINLTNRCIYPYTLNTLLGIHYNKIELIERCLENDKKMEQIYKIIKILTGGFEFLPTSPKQCVEYFHKLMGYPVVGRTPTGNPSLSEGFIYKLQLKLKSMEIENPVLDLVIKYRQLGKETGTLKFIPWKDENENNKM